MGIMEMGLKILIYMMLKIQSRALKKGGDGYRLL